VEEEVERFVEAQIIKIDDNKWGNKLSQVRARPSAPMPRRQGRR
jgi:hypothetical protein